MFEFGGGWKVAEEQQVDDFFEAHIRRKIVDVVSTVCKPPDLTFDITQNRGPDDNAFKPAIDNRTCGRQVILQRKPPSYEGGESL
jgi:hypothetical protein